MIRRKSRTRSTWIAVLATIAGVLIVVSGASVSQADPSPAAWPKVLDNISLGTNGTILTSPDSSFTVPNCSSETYSTVNMETFASNALVKYPKPAYNNPTIALCLSQDTVGADGTVYAADRTYSGGYKKIAAYKNGIKLWVMPWQAAPGCSSPHWKDSNFTIGADGNLYVLQENNSCTGTKVYLMGIDGRTGGLLFRSPVRSYYFGVTNNHLFAYQNGLVVRDGGMTVKYFDYEGAEQGSYTFTLAAGESLSEPWAVDFNGTVSVSVRRGPTNNSADQDCARYYEHSRVLRHTVDGTDQDIRLTGPGSIGECLGLILKASPDGLAIRAVDFANMPYNKLLFIHDDGTVQPVISISNTGFNLNTYYNAFSVDSTGDVLVERTVYTSSTSDPQVQLLRYGSTGTLLSTFSTTSIALNSTDRFVPTGWGEGDIPLVPGHALLTVCKSQCSSTNLETIHKVPLSGLGMDYPRSAMFDAIEDAQGEQKVYVNLGDSFASQEGVPGVNGFIPPSNTNGCHRSEHAYAILLDQDSSLDLNLQSFRACSGATTQTLVSGMNGENGQLASLSEQTDIVTVSISGNDIDFGGGMTACSMTTDAQVCEDTLSVVNGNVHSPWFQQRLEDTYAAIATAAPNAEVFVVGYPHIMGLPGEPHCNWYAHPMTPAEMALVDDIATTLNDVIEAEALQAGFTFVPLAETFGDHTPCSLTPFINGVVLSHNEYSYHPNAAGAQAIYQELLAVL